MFLLRIQYGIIHQRQPKEKLQNGAPACGGKKGTPACGGSSFRQSTISTETLAPVRWASGTHHSADLLGDAALTADDLPHVLRGDAQLQRQLLVALDLGDRDAARDRPPGFWRYRAASPSWLRPPDLEDVDFFQQSAHGVGGLSAGLDPLLGALSVDLDLGRGDAGIVSADLLDEAAIAGDNGSPPPQRGRKEPSWRPCGAV